MSSLIVPAIKVTFNHINQKFQLHFEDPNLTTQVSLEAKEALELHKKLTMWLKTRRLLE